MNEMELINLIANKLNEKLAEDIVLIDFTNRGYVADYFMICTAKNYRHASSLVDFVEEEVLKNGYEIKHINNVRDSGWLVIDMNDVVLHIFTQSDRELYQLERLWQDLPITKM